MICHADSLLSIENKRGKQIHTLTTIISVGLGIYSAFYGPNTHIWLLCMGREEIFKFDFENIFRNYAGGSGFNMKLHHPLRILANLVMFVFIFGVPILYYKVFKFRQVQDNSVQGLEETSFYNKELGNGSKT